MEIKSYLPIVVRYAIVSLAGAMFARGWLTNEQSAILSQNTDLLVSALVGLATLGWALFKRPSSKAMDAAKQIDQKLPAAAPVVIKTPANQPDIVVTPK